MLYWMFMTVVYMFQGYMVHSLCDSGVGGLAPMAELAPPSPTRQTILEIGYHPGVHHSLLKSTEKLICPTWHKLVAFDTKKLIF